MKKSKAQGIFHNLLWFVAVLVSISSVCAFAQDESDARKQHANTACLSCHEELDTEMAGQAHHAISNACVLCHGEGEEHILSDGEQVGQELLVFRDDFQEAVESNAICLECHRDTNRLHWPGSAHEAEELLCSDCHNIHQADPVLNEESQAEVCYDCHQTVRADMLKPYRHPLPEGKMACSGCHQPHGTASDRLLKGFTVTETCTGCHGEKRGPYLWEHFPVSEDCTLCHDAHGSIHPGSLVKRRPHLCQSCHQPTAEFAARHARRPVGYWEPGISDAVNRLVLGESCMNCHVQVHGSNHPSGARLMR